MGFYEWANIVILAITAFFVIGFVYFGIYKTVMAQEYLRRDLFKKRIELLKKQIEQMRK